MEVKRPEHGGTLMANLDRGVDQLREYEVSGAVILDVTDCVRGLAPEALVEEVNALASQVDERIFVENEGYNPGYSPVMVAFVLARGAWSDQEDMPRLQVVSVSAATVYAKTPRSLLDHRARWLCDAFKRGVEASGFAVDSRDRSSRL